MAFDWPQRAIVFVSRSDRHVVETAVRHARHSHFVEASVVGHMTLSHETIDRTLSVGLLGIECGGLFHRS